MSLLNKISLPMKATNTLLVVSVIATLGGFFAFNGQQTQKNNLLQAQTGNGICFQRISQTFTALMVKDLSSNFLAKEFRTNTSQCLEDLSGLIGATAMAKTLNNLQSDYHWFNQKISRLVDMVQGESVDIYQSNIINKYSELESLRDKIDQQITEASSTQSKLQAFSQTVMALGIVSFFLLGLANILRTRTRERELEKLEAHPELDFDVLHSRFFAALDQPKIEELYTKRLHELESENIRLEEALIKMNTFGEEVVYEIDLPEGEGPKTISSFNLAFNNVLDRLQDKAFEAGVILDTDLNEEFSIFSEEEPLEQLLLSLLSFAMDQGQRVQVRSKALGGIAYCKVKIPGFAFSESDIAFMNGADPVDGTPVNLVILRELLEDATAKVAIKNKKNSKENLIESEIEMIFERAKTIEKAEEKTSTVVKGSKAQIREFLDSQL